MWRTAPPCLLAALFSLAGGLPARADDAAGVELFESKIRPLLERHCVDCHGADEQESELRLDSPAALMRGGASGAAVAPGRPEASLLLAAVKQQGELKMPPEGKLTEREIADLQRWIQIGAPLPDGVVAVRREAIDWDEARKHWAFRPLDPGTLPEVADRDWVRTGVDAYVLRQLEARSLSPSPRADKRTLLRRVTLNLTGLPPTPEEAERFLADDSPQAYARLVDRLLSSAAYGERWGRHWLDVARYADSNGLDENIAHGNAWRYRDWVIESLNRDLPYDRFVHEQLAGDLLPYDSPSQRRRQLIATGFLSLGPKVLAEVDEVKMEMDIIDEQLDTLGKSLLGLTIGCARCHDHKFDPLEAKDYYALAGIFKSTRTMEHYTKIARWNEHSLPLTDREQREKQQLDSELEDAKQQLAQWQARAKEQTAAAQSASAADAETAGAETAPDAEGNAAAAEPAVDPKQKIAELTATIKKLETRAENLASAMGLGERDVANVRVHIRGSHLTLGDEVPRRFPQVLDPRQQPLDDETSGRLELARWLTTSQQHLTARVIANRVWRWHWGRGLTPSMDNFGRLGEPPSHPGLLDHLASELIRGDWSLKRLHREILLSSTYQQSTAFRDDPAAADPDNRWMWRARPRRLEAEALRDSLLAVAGRLDRTMGGSLLHVDNRAFFFDHTSKDETNYEAPRRSVYLPVVRNNLYDVFMLFDYSDASVLQGHRGSSITAPQSLYLLNGPVIDEAAAGLVRRTAALQGERRAAAMFQLAFSRPAAQAELSSALKFVESYDGLSSPSKRVPHDIAAGRRDRGLTRVRPRIGMARGDRVDGGFDGLESPSYEAQATDEAGPGDAAQGADEPAWRALAHALLASNEFMYVR